MTHSETIRCISSRGRQAGITIAEKLLCICLVLTMLFVAAFPASRAFAQANHGPSGLPQDTVAGASIRLDAQLVDAQRQLDLLTTLGQIGAALGQLQPYRESILILLDPGLPVHERWRSALRAEPAHVPQQSTGNADQIEWLRMEIEALRAEMSLLQNLPNIIHTPPPAEPGDLTVTENDDQGEPAWEIDSSSLRYVQLAEAGLEPAIWLASDTAGVRVVQKETIRHQGRMIHLSDLRRDDSGRIQVHLIVDGEPYILTY